MVASLSPIKTAVSLPAQSGGERARATFDSAGNLYVVWQAADTGPMQTYLVKIDPAGNVGPVRNLGNTLAGAGSNGLPDIFAPPGSNRLYLAIEANPQSPTAYESLDGGASWTGAHTLATGLGSQTQPRIVGDANGNITVTYLAGGSISAASRDAAGNWSASQNITPNLGGWQSRSHEIALAQDGSNNVYEVYSSAAPGGGGAGFVMRSGQSGAWLAQQDNVSGNNGNNSNGFGVAATTDGTIWVGSSVAGGGPDTFMVASAPAAGGAQPSFSAPAVAMAPPGGATKASLSAYGPTVYYVSGTDDRHAFETGFTTNGPPAGTPPSGNVSGPATATIGQQPTTYTATITGQNLGAVEVYAIPKGQTGPPFTLIGKAIVGQTPGCGATSCTYSAAWTPPASATAGQQYTIFINGFSGGTDNSSSSGKCTGWPLPQPPARSGTNMSGS